MIYLLLGSDDFTKNEYILTLAKEIGGQPDVFFDPETLPNISDLSQTDLFSKEKIYVLKGLLQKYNDPNNIEKLIATRNRIIFVEEKLDKRSADNKKLLNQTGIQVKEFVLPHGRELNNWIQERAKYYGAKFSQEAIENLSVALGRDLARETKFGGKVVSVEEVYNLWQADNEIKKLSDYAGTKEVSAGDVKNLVAENGEMDVYELTNAIADGEKNKSLFLLHQFFKQQSGTDEKGGVIQLNALLSDQFRNIAIVQEYLKQKKSEDEILSSTGWKSGRLFIIKKVAVRFNDKKVLDFLNKLKALDEEMKTSSVPPKVLLDLIVSQLF